MSTSRLLALRSRMFRCTRHGTTPQTSRACHAYEHKPRPASAPPPLFSRSAALSHVLLAMFNRLVATQNDGVRCRGACLCLLAFFVCHSTDIRCTVHPHIHMRLHTHVPFACSMQGARCFFQWPAGRLPSLRLPSVLRCVCVPGFWWAASRHLKPAAAPPPPLRWAFSIP